MPSEVVHGRPVLLSDGDLLLLFFCEIVQVVREVVEGLLRNRLTDLLPQELTLCLFPVQWIPIIEGLEVRSTTNACGVHCGF